MMMSLFRSRYRSLIILSFSLMLFAAACGLPGPETEPMPVIQEYTYAIDPLFREIYDLLGGQEVLGPALSPRFRHGDRELQYIHAGCLEYNYNLPSSERYRLSPLGLEMNLTEPGVPEPDQPNLVYINGHVVYSGFVEKYRALGGARFVGKPLTEVHYNSKLKRYEQYFENLGFYWLEYETPENIRLLAYGGWKCENTVCEGNIPEDRQIFLPINGPSVDEVFKNVVSRWGNDFTGMVLSNVYHAEDGESEQIYESIVIATDADKPAGVQLRPLPMVLGITTGQMTEANPTPGYIFWVLEDGDLGHNVPQQFYDYIVLHGGIEISGPPIEEIHVEGDVVRQCFTNYCLDYHLNDNLPEDMRIRPAALGYEYRDRYHRSQMTPEPQSQSLGAITLQVWERYPLVSSNQSQEIGASVYEAGAPLKDIEPVLVLSMPDGSQSSYYFPPTGEDGKTILTLEFIQAMNGTMITYQVCVSSLANEVFCVKDGFLIWFNP